MQPFKDLLSFNLVRLLNYFSFRIKTRTDSYAHFSNAERTESYYLFQESNKDQLSIFGTSKGQVLDKENLFFELAGFYPLPQTKNLIEVISGSSPADPTPSFEKYSTPEGIAIVAFSIGALPQNEFPWTGLRHFERRIFLSRNKQLTVPLCVYEDRKFKAFTNSVSWDGPKRLFVSDRTDGFYTSALTEFAVSAFITSNPYSWERLAQSGDIEMYFFLLAHDEATQQIFHQLLNLVEKEKLKDIVFPVTSDLKENTFILNFINYIFSKRKTDFSFRFTPQNSLIELSAIWETDSVPELVSFISHIDLEIQSFFYNGLKEEISINSNVIRSNGITTKKEVVDDRTLFSIKFRREPQIVFIVLTELLSFFYPEIKIRFLVIS